MRNIYSALCQIFSGILSRWPDELSPETKVNRLSYQELAAAAIACEKTFHIEMEDERIAGLIRLADWVDYIRERIGEKEDGRPAPTDQERESWYYS